MEEWKEYRLGEIVDLVIDYRGKTPLKLGGEWTSSGYRALSAKNIKTGRIVNEDSIRYVDEDLYKKWMKDEVQRGDILITSEAPFGQIYYWDSDEKIVLSQRLFCVRISSSTCSKFVYHYMTTAEFQAELDGRATGTTVVGLRQPELLKCKISLPSLPTQQKIASILSSLDDKIEVNRRINAELEELAQALFKSWFVNFEPFKDGDFVESELGMIPKGWKVGTFSEIVQSTLGGDWGKEIEQGNYAKKVFCIRGADIPEIKSGNRGKMPIRFILDKNFQKKALETNDLVVEISGGSPTQSTGRICRVTNDLLEKYDNSLICTNFCRAIKPKGEYSSYIYYLWQYLYDIGRMFNYENGTTGIKNLMINDIIEKEVVVIPSVIVAEEFANVIRTISTKIQKNGEETETLTTLRDTLLPKLMSGEIDVNDVAL